MSEPRRRVVAHAFGDQSEELAAICVRRSQEGRPRSAASLAAFKRSCAERSGGKIYEDGCPRAAPPINNLMSQLDAGDLGRIYALLAPRRGSRCRLKSPQPVADNQPSPDDTARRTPPRSTR